MEKTIEGISPIASNDKIEQVLEALHHLIIDGNLRPGTELPPERELAAQMQISRFSLREALRAAQAEGLIEIKRGKKPTVTTPSASAAAKVMGITLRRSEKPLLDLVKARQGLECQIVRLAAENATKEHIDGLDNTIDIMKKNNNNLSICAEKDIEFHNILLEASNNVVFEIMLAPVAELLKKSRVATLHYRGIDRAINGHVKIFEAIKNRDANAASEAMSYHLEMAEDDLKHIENIETGI
jgi:GntR family transcriptional regulator, transcriptional repressor for pyruvate dehydrogenase complex